jgi:hypothetical protein
MITIDLRKVLLLIFLVVAAITAYQYRDVQRYLRMRNM